MKAQDLKTGDTIEVKIYNPETLETEWIPTKLTRTSDHFVWFKNSGFCRIKRSTIDQGIFYRILNETI